MISVIVVYNKENFESSLLSISLARQSVRFELILVENIDNRNFTSAAHALNFGAGKASGEVLMFVHQDVDLLDDQFIEKAELMVNEVGDIGVAGVAGMAEYGLNHQDRQRNIIFQGVPSREWGREIKKPERVQTLDECLLLVPKKVFDMIKFDSKVCGDWHLYGVDYCLSVTEIGKEAYALPLPIYHQSTGGSAKVKRKLFGGSLSAEYFSSFEAVRRKHKPKFEAIHTTCASFSTSYPVLWQRVVRMLWRLISFSGK